MSISAMNIKYVCERPTGEYAANGIVIQNTNSELRISYAASATGAKIVARARITSPQWADDQFGHSGNTVIPSHRVRLLFARQPNCAERPIIASTEHF